MASLATMCKVPKRKVQDVERELTRVIGMGLYDGSELLARIHSGASTIEAEAARMIEEERDQILGNVDAASAIVRLRNVPVKRRKAASKGEGSSSRSARKSAPAVAASSSEAGAVIVAESVKGAPAVAARDGGYGLVASIAAGARGSEAPPAGVVVPIRPEVSSTEWEALVGAQLKREGSSEAGALEGPRPAGDPVAAYLARLVYGPKREYCAALIEGRPVSDPGTDWARKVRERLRYYGLEV